MKKIKLVCIVFATICVCCVSTGLYFILRTSKWKPSHCTDFEATKYLFEYYQNESDANFNLYCEKTFRLKHMCQSKLNIFAPTYKYILKNRPNEFKAEGIYCRLFNECNKNINPLDFKIDVSRGPMLEVNTEPKTYNFDEKSFQPNELITIVQLSDFHYDPYYAPGSSSDCTEFVCCRSASTPAPNSTDKAGYWGDYRCDSPGHLVENICSQVALNHKKIDLIYYTGDFADHFGWATSQSHVKHAIEFITRQIKEKFPNTPVIMAFGNHDNHPSDAFAPQTVDDASINSRWLYNFVADLWSDWLPLSALATLRVGGYYSFVFRPGFRIIVLNNNHCFYTNPWLFYGASEMITQLEWLRDTLIQAEMYNEKVHILGHVPSNTEFCTKAWNREYSELVRNCSHLISGQFNSHTHNDSFTIYYSTHNDKPIPLNVAWIAGSGTAFMGVNPNYRLYTVEPKTYEVIDVDTYIFNLTEANATPDRPPKWFKEYSFREAFGVDDLSPYTLSKLVNETWRHDRQSLYKMWTFYHKMSDAQFAKGCDDACLEYVRQEINGELF